MMKYKYILFDLDGTVSESAAGIRRSLEYAIETIGCPMPNLDDYTLYVGPPLIDTFLNLVGLDTETAERAAQPHLSGDSRAAEKAACREREARDLFLKIRAVRGGDFGNPRRARLL